MKQEVYIDWGSGLPSKGALQPDYMIIGIAPSTKRPSDRRFEPFGASSHALLEQIRRGVSAEGSTLYVTNLIREPREPRKKIYKADWSAWLVECKEEINRVEPKRIMTVGALPSKALIPGFRNLREDHGTLFPVEFEFGEVVIMPCYHFSMIRDQPDIIQNDLVRFFTLDDPEEPNYKILPFAEFLEQLETARAPVVVDVETTGVGVGTDKITMLGSKPLGPGPGLILMEPEAHELRTLIRRVFLKNRVVGHNLPFDLAMIFASAGFSDPTQYPLSKMGSLDTMTRAHIAGEEILGLKHLATMHTDRPGAHGFGGPESPAYLAEDLFTTEALAEKFRDQDDRFITQLSEQVIPKLGLMRARGVFIDLALLDKIGERFKRSIRELEARLPSEINWNSPKQVADALQNLGIKLSQRTPSGAFSTSEQALNELMEGYPEDTEQGKLLRDILDLRGMSKLHKGFIVGYYDLADDKGFLHPNLKIAATRTGRFSCTSPNLQQVPRLGPLKTIFVSRWEQGLYGLVDLSQAELRVAALLSGDLALLQNLQASDPHKANAAMLYSKPEEEVTAIERKKSKAIMFGVLYGGSAAGLASRTKFDVESIQEAMDLMHKRFPGLNQWVENVQQDGLDKQEVWTLFGRRRNLAQVFREEGFGGVKRKAVNTPIQSLASDINLFIMNEAANEIERRKLHSYPLFMVHDSILFEIAPGEAEELEEIITLAFQRLEFTPLSTLDGFWDLPIIGDLVIGRSWAEVESTNEGYRPIKEIRCSSHV